jgi:2-dehydro-3-deoxygluconokinase
VTLRLAGAESNVAIGLARLGHAVEWLGRVSRDRFGDLVLRELAAEGVDTSHAVRDDAPTGLMFVEQRTADVTQVEYRRAGSAGSRVTADDVAPAIARAPRLVHLTGITAALSPTLPAVVAEIAKSASAVGSLVSLDVNHRSRLWTRDAARTALADIVPHTGVVIASEDELELAVPADVTGEDAAVEHLLARGVHQVAVKRGHRGASLHTAEGRVDLPAVAVTAVDPIGAGDAFTAGLLSGSLDELDAPARLERAVLTGAFAVSSHGDWEGAPRRDELDLLRVHRSGTTLR